MIVFIVSSPGATPENVILEANDSAAARYAAGPILGGDPNRYIVDVITGNGHLTVFLLRGMAPR